MKRWLLISFSVLACHGEPAPKPTEFRATLDAWEFLGTYDVRIDAPAGYAGKVSNARTAWVEAPAEPTIIVGVDTFADENAPRAPCDMHFPLRSVPHTMRSRIDLADGHIAICDEADEPGMLVVRYVRRGTSRLYCLAKLDDRSTKFASNIVEICKGMTVHGPHIDDVSPEVWDEATIAEIDTAKQVQVRLRIPIGYVKHVDSRVASWAVPRSPRTWPSISVSVAPASRGRPAPEGFMMKVKDGATSAARFIQLDGVSVMCLVVIRGSIDSQIAQLKEVCASMTARM